MTRQPQHELFSGPGSRPESGRSEFARADFALERAYARRRKITLAVLAVIVAGGAYAAWSRRPTNPADIPTFQSAGDYKQKPADPGGIDIPHQDVRVYNELDSVTNPSAPPAVEHLLPPPEVPVKIAHTAPTAVVPAAPAPVAAPAPQAEKRAVETLPPAQQIKTTEAKPVPVAAAPAPTPTPVPAPTPAPATRVEVKPALPVTTPVAEKPAKAVKESSPTSIAQLIAETKPNASLKPAAGHVSVQLASVQDEAKAKAMLMELQKKYASALQGSQLRLVRADLGAKGIFYRIQSQGLTEEGANRICSSLKQMKAGCILVR